MNYNEEYRTPRDRVSGNCSRGTHRPACGCTQPNRITPINNFNTSCRSKMDDEHIHHNSQRMPECTQERVQRESSCSCDNNAQPAREARIMPAPCRNTVCTTVPVQEGCVDTYPIAMAYVPMQQWRDLYDPISALSHGTIFRELDLEWYPTNCRKDTCK